MCIATTFPAHCTLWVQHDNFLNFLLQLLLLFLSITLHLHPKSIQIVNSFTQFLSVVLTKHSHLLQFNIVSSFTMKLILLTAAALASFGVAQDITSLLGNLPSCGVSYTSFKLFVHKLTSRSKYVSRICWHSLPAWDAPITMLLACAPTWISVTVSEIARMNHAPRALTLLASSPLATHTAVVG